MGGRARLRARRLKGQPGTGTASGVGANGSLSRPPYDPIVEPIKRTQRISCVCGQVVEGQDDDDLWAKAQAHIAADHPDLVGKVSRADILAQAEEI